MLGVSRKYGIVKLLNLTSDGNHKHLGKINEINRERLTAHKNTLWPRASLNCDWKRVKRSGVAIFIEQ